MVKSISPTYCAEGELNTEFILEGENFLGVPDDAVGLYAYENNNPLMYRDTEAERLLYHVVEKSPTRLVLRCSEPVDWHGNNYLGGILTADRNKVLWINDTKPLP